MNAATQMMSMMDLGAEVHHPTQRSHAEHHWAVATTALLLWPEGMTVAILRSALSGVRPPDMSQKARSVLCFADSYQRLFNWTSDDSSIQRSEPAIRNIQLDANLHMSRMPQEAQERAAQFLTLTLLGEIKQ